MAFCHASIIMIEKFTGNQSMGAPGRIDIASFFDDRPLGRLQLLVMILCGLVVLFDGLDTQVIGYLGPALSSEWDIPRERLGPIFSASLVGLMVGLLAVGMISDRFGRRITIIVSVTLFSICTLLTAFAQGVGDLVIYRFLAGIGLGGAMPNALALTGEYCPRRMRATLVIIMFCGFSLGSILGGLISAALLPSIGWRAVFITGGVLPLLLVPFLIAWLPESLQYLVNRPDRASHIRAILRRIRPTVENLEVATFIGQEQKSDGVPVAELFVQGRGIGTLMLWFIFFMNLMVFYFLQNWLPTIFSDAGLPIEQAVLMTTLISVGGIVAGLITGPLMDRYDAYRVLAGLYLLGTLFVTFIGFATPALLALATFGAGFCVSGAQKSINALAVIFYPTRMRSTGVGWALGIGRFGSILGPVVGGWLLAIGWSSASLFRLAAVPMLLAAVFIFMMGAIYAGKKGV
jgi:MFS transporter, AAHS family, 4-hydroxybenzoate transporter